MIQDLQGVVNIGQPVWRTQERNIRKRRRLGGAAWNKRLLEESEEFRVVMVSHCLSPGSFSLAGLLLGEEKTFLSSSRITK